MCRNALYMIRNVIFCGECDDYCPYKHKLCDNCFECLDEPTEDYAKITIDAILMDENEIKKGRERRAKFIFLLLLIP